MKAARVVSNGNKVAGTAYDLLSEEAKNALDSADIILSKGQGNYETLNGTGRHIFYALLCKCDLFTSRFKVPRLTGVFTEENGGITAEQQASAAAIQETDIPLTQEISRFFSL